MSRPIPENIDRSDPLWPDKVNGNFNKVFGQPFAMYNGSLTGFNAAKYKNCLVLVGGVLYISDGSAWVPYRAQLTNIASLNPATATLDDIKTAMNQLISDAISKGWMA
jgi:hypothetical protein